MTNFQGPSRRTLFAGAALAAGAAAAAPALAQRASANASLTGKTILITGASSGFGRLGAEHYARLGARVFATMRNLPRPEADALRTLAAKEKLKIEVLALDVTSDASVAEAIAKAETSAGGRLDVLINNAGIAISGPIEVQDMEATKLAFETNVFGPHRTARAALPAMRAAKKGLIINVSSQLGRLIVPGYGQYSPTKFALEAMSEQLAYELSPHGVDVTIVQPGGYPTQIWANSQRYAAALKTRAPNALLTAYPELAAAMDAAGAQPRETDPLDVPRAIAEIIALPAGERPLRRAVHPTFRPQEPINDVSAKTQLAFLGNSMFGPWVKGVLGG